MGFRRRRRNKAAFAAQFSQAPQRGGPQKPAQKSMRLDDWMPDTVVEDYDGEVEVVSNTNFAHALQHVRVRGCRSLFLAPAPPLHPRLPV